MLFKLLLLVPMLVGSKGKDYPPSFYQRSEDAAGDCIEAVESLYPKADETAKLLIARRWYMMSFHESLFFTSPGGSNDNGAACGVLQAHLPPKECTKARLDRVYAYARGIEMGENLISMCGGIEEGMSAYASGKCPKKGTSLLLIHYRCKRIGGC